MLYDKLDYQQEKVLYFDTDSIIFIDDETKNVETGVRNPIVLDMVINKN